MPPDISRRRGELALVMIRLSVLGCCAALAGTLGMLAWRGLSGM